MYDFDAEVSRAIDIVSRHTMVPPELIPSSDRHHDIAMSRHIVARILYDRYSAFGMSLKKIGEKLGGRDHTTVINSCRAVQDALDTDPAFKNVFEKIVEEFNDA